MHLRTPLAVLLAFSGSLGATPAHDGDPEWLDGARLDQGLYVRIHHPRVIRDLRSFGCGLVVTNVDGATDAVVNEVRYHLGADGGPLVRRPAHTLETRRAAYAQYKVVREVLEAVDPVADPARTEELVRQRTVAMFEIAEGSLVERFDVEEAWIDPEAVSYRMTVEVDLVQNGVARTLRKPVVVPIQPPLPDGTGRMRRIAYDALTGVSRPLAPAPGDAQVGGSAWYAGDQHLHTVYSVDAFLLSQNIFHAGFYALVADLYGLDWIITTDHSNIHFSLFGYEWYTEDQLEASAQQTQAYRDATGFQAYAGQEMGLGS
ncbi:MAG: hypothetical protein QF903_09515, partial [Planctomycetota bacterium]|nr:hypothetical protein [Planctomycetota bacterium]